MKKRIHFLLFVLALLCVCVYVMSFCPVFLILTRKKIYNISSKGTFYNAQFFVGLEFCLLFPNTRSPLATRWIFSLSSRSTVCVRLFVFYTNVHFAVISFWGTVLRERERSGLRKLLPSSIKFPMEVLLFFSVSQFFFGLLFLLFCCHENASLNKNKHLTSMILRYGI